MIVVLEGDIRRLFTTTNRAEPARFTTDLERTNRFHAGPDTGLEFAARQIDTSAALSIGRAFTASGLTIAGGFAALALSGFPLLSSFGRSSR